LLIRRRKELHRRAGEALERLYPDQKTELSSVLAHHFWLGEEWHRAAEYAMRAGEQAVKVYAMSEALGHYDHAYKAFEKIPDASPEQRCDAILGWTRAAFKLKPYEEVEDRLKEAEEIARELDDEARLAQVLHWIANVYISHGFPGRGMPPLFESYELAERLGEQRLTLVATFWMTLGMIDRDPRAGLKQIEHVIEGAHEYRNWEVESHALASKAMAHARLGEFEEALDAIRRAHESVKKTNSLVKEADVALHSAQAFFDMGDVQRGFEYSKRGMEKAIEAHGLECAMAACYVRGLGNLQTRNAGEAQRVFEAALELREDNIDEFVDGSELMVHRAHAGLAIAQLFGGRGEAIEDMERLLSNAEALGDDYTAALIAQALGEGYTGSGEFERAKRHLDAAHDYYRRNDMRPYEARVLQSLAYWNERQGREEEAERARAQAHRIVEELSLPPLGSPRGGPASTDEPRSAGSTDH
jgi:tetratricopeptide (TPR) repeat protein